jgi:hypothetical protein
VDKATPMVGEMERWLTPERLATSQLMRLLHDGFLEGAWDGDAMADLALAALRGFGNGCCFYLASAVSGVTGLPIAVFWRMGIADLPIVHAAVVDPASGDAFDILGRRPLGELRAELVDVVGRIRMAVEPPLAIGDEMDAEEADVLLDIAAGMPWMPPVGRAAPPKPDWARLVVGYAAARDRMAAARK